ncbi:unnamed protein product, partial [Cyprideis torosa]
MVVLVCPLSIQKFPILGDIVSLLPFRTIQFPRIP